MRLKKNNIFEKFESIADYWHPHIIAELNGQEVKIAKVMDDFIWHKHDAEDEFFYVVKGHLEIELRDQRIELKPGEYVVIPKGVEHRPKAREETWILMFEPASTIKTGNSTNKLTKKKLKKI